MTTTHKFPLQDGYAWGQQAALRLINSQYIKITNSKVAHVGRVGIFGTTCNYVTVEQSHISDTGAHGLLFLYAHSKRPIDNVVVTNNKFEGCGMTNFWQPACIWGGAHTSMTVANNDLRGPSPTMIRINGVMPHGKAYLKGRHISALPRDEYVFHVEKNRIHDFGRSILNDFGAIYIGAKGKCDAAIQPDFDQQCFVYAHIYKNMIAEGSAYRSGSAFLYSDVSSSANTFEKNVLYGKVDVAVKHHCGVENLSKNNFVYIPRHKINATEPNSDRDRYLLGGCGKVDRFDDWENQHNIYYVEDTTQLNVFRPFKYQITKKMHDNLWWTPKGASFGKVNLKFWKDYTWEGFRAQGYGNGSQWASPRFAKMSPEELVLAPKSPALAMGIEQINVADIGIQAAGKYVPV